MTTSVIDSIDKSIKVAKVTVEFGSAVARLADNRDFKTVMINGYFRDEAVRLVHLKADPSMQSAESQRSILSQMDSIGAMSLFLAIAVKMGGMAGQQVAADEATREEILAEELTND